MNVNELFSNKEMITLESYLEKCSVKDIEEYVNPTGKYIDDFHLYTDIPYAVQEIKYWANFDDVKIFIVQDGDGDGVCSTVILYQYLVNLNPNWTVNILLHTSKQRGLEDDYVMNRIREERPNLVFVPDAGTNNVVQAEELCEMGVGLIVLDHHDYDTPIQKGILINNQNTDYNVQREGSGALVTHKFLQALDEEFNKDWSSWFIDLVALSLISDSRDMNSMENREYYHFGLETRDCINNEFLGALVDTFIGDRPYTQKDLSFKIVPKINAICRHSDIELKKNLIMYFIGILPIEDGVNLCEIAHKEQIEKVTEIVENNKDKIMELSNNNIVVFASDDIPRSYSGLICGKVMNLCDNKPSIVGCIKDDYFIGSLRSPIPLRKELNDNELVDFAQGHENSCGIGIHKDNIQPLIDYYNSIEMSYNPQIDVLKSFTLKSIRKNLFGLFEPYNALWGKGIEKPMFHISNITFNPSDWKIIGKNSRTLKMTKENIDIIIFNCLKEDKENLGLGHYENDTFVYEPQNSKANLEVIGQLIVNEYKGRKTLQIVVDKYEVSCYNKSTVEDLI